MNIGKRFKMYRERRGLSQKEAAELLGVKGYQLANYECNRSEPNLKTLRLMSKVYHVSLDHLLATAPIYGDNFLEEQEIREREMKEFKEKLETLINDFVNANEKNK